MKTRFLKWLPVVAAVLLATSCSKDDGNDANTVKNPENTVVQDEDLTVPFSLVAGTDQSVSKIAYQEDAIDKKSHLLFEETDVLTITGDGVSGTLTNPTITNDGANATFSGTLTCTSPEAKAALLKGGTLTASMGSAVSVAATYPTIEEAINHSYQVSDEFTYSTDPVSVTLKEQNAYLYVRGSYITDITVFYGGSSTGNTYALTSNAVCVVVPAGTVLNKIEANGDQHLTLIDKGNEGATLERKQIYSINRLSSNEDKKLSYKQDANGGSFKSEPSDSKMTFGQSFSEPGECSRSGFELIGWSASQDGSDGLWDFSRGIDRDITLYAQWLAEGAVMYREYSFDEVTMKVSYTEKTIAAGTYTELTDGYDRALAGGDWYVVSGDITINTRIPLDNYGRGSDIHLILKDGSKLTAKGGISNLGYDKHLIIYGQSEGTGVLVTTGRGYAAGIGGDDEGNAACSVTIHGGNITATSEDGCGIGHACHGGFGGTLTMYNGTLVARGGNSGAGIGCGEYSAYWPIGAGTVRVYGGSITATGGVYCAGIGGGYNSAGGTLEVYGGTVEALGLHGIGAGMNASDNGTLFIADGLTVKAGNDEASATATTASDYITNRNQYVKISAE